MLHDVAMGEDPESVGDRLGSEFSEAVVLFHEALGATLGLSATDHKALGVLTRDGPMSAGALAQRLALSKAAVTGLIDRLELAGLAQREQDRGDRRKLVVRAVPADNDDFQQALAGLRTAMAELTGHYSSDELAVIGDWVGRTTKVLREQTAAITGRDHDHS